ncbi:MAG TPA: hypothetical protein PKE29_14355 [Phycisphaerales bacterium]|nr:hypothetical protein [Phycisphaerales bacterium]
MNKKSKNIAAVAVLALAGGALFVDRFVLGYGPASAAAAVETTADLLNTPPKPATSAIAVASGGPSVTQRVASLGVHLASFPGPTDAEASDAFIVPAVWRPAPEPAPVESVPSHDGHAPDAQAETLTLSAVVCGDSPRTSAATINGVVVQVGESYRGYTLLSVHRSAVPSALLRGPGGEVTLYTKIQDAVRAAQDRDGKPMIRPHRLD